MKDCVNYVVELIAMILRKSIISYYVVTHIRSQKQIYTIYCVCKGIFINLMSTKDENILFHISAFIYDAMQRKEQL